MNRYLLEIGVEEFPAQYINSTKTQIKRGIEKLLKEEMYTFQEIKIQSTPRRFAILIDNIQKDHGQEEEKVKGPSKKIAFDADGNPSKALQGFMRSKKVELEDISIEKIGEEEYVFALIKNQVKNLDEVLKTGLPKVIKSVSNPKSMKWGGKNFRFLRPIRWIVSLLNDEILSFDLDGISIGRTSKGHRFLGSSSIEIDKIDNYEKLLEENYVILNEEKRKTMITRGSNRLAKEKGGNLISDEALLYEIVHINEYPTPFLGSFDNKYLSLPKEVIITPMKDHQRYFPVEDDHGNLLPYFISVRNGDDKGMENVIQGNEKVLVARLEDAKFFYEQDLSNELEDYLDDLRKLSYHENLGSMYDKSQRLKKLVESIGKLLETGEEAIAMAKRAAHLSKADLVTKTVIEFTELQGVMGRIYAEKSGESSIVSQAIEEQYMPVHAGGKLPETTAGVMLSIADKLDNICGLHSQDIVVTGSQDPYGQRRAALGIINILIDNKMNIDLRDLIRDALYNLVEEFGLVFSYDEVSSNIVNFIKSRLRNKLRDEGYSYDLIDSVIDQDELDIYAIYEKVVDLSKFEKENNDFEEDITSFVRIFNISKDAENLEINIDILEENDRKIYDLKESFYLIDKKLAIGEYYQALILLKENLPMINDYLDKTMINVDDKEIKENRIALLNNIAKRIETIFDPRAIVRK